LYTNCRNIPRTFSVTSLRHRLPRKAPDRLAEKGRTAPRSEAAHPRLVRRFRPPRRQPFSTAALWPPTAGDPPAQGREANRGAEPACGTGPPGARRSPPGLRFRAWRPPGRRFPPAHATGRQSRGPGHPNTHLPNRSLRTGDRFESARDRRSDPRVWESAGAKGNPAFPATVDTRAAPRLPEKGPIPSATAPPTFGPAFARGRPNRAAPRN